MFEQTLSADAESNLAALSQTPLATQFYLAGILIASLQDLAAMKIDAITRRGVKRDFIDLYFIGQEAIPLAQALELYFEKFKAFNISPAHVYKSLQYFEDAEADAMPMMLKNITWDRVKRYFLSEGRALSRRRIE
jgi:hypothetical protein